MNKADLIDAMAQEASIHKVQAEAALGAFMEAVRKALKKGDRVQLVGFGTFSVSKRAARTGRNPQTGEQIKISARRVLTFRPSQVLKAMLNGEEYSHLKDEDDDE